MSDIHLKMINWLRSKGVDHDLAQCITFMVSSKLQRAVWNTTLIEGKHTNVERNREEFASLLEDLIVQHIERKQDETEPPIMFRQ